MRFVAASKNPDFGLLMVKTPLEGSSMYFFPAAFAADLIFSLISWEMDSTVPEIVQLLSTSMHTLKSLHPVTLINLIRGDRDM